MSRRESEAGTVEARATDEDRIEALARVAGGWAHDFNDILTIVLSKSDLVVDALPSGLPELRADLDDLRRAARRGADMTEKLLAFARRRRLDLETVDLVRIVEDMRRTVLRILPRGIELRIAVSDQEAFSVEANAPAVQQILLNLVTNARDAMHEGGTLTVGLERVSGGAIHLVVSDTGPGLDPSVAERVFEPFFTTKSTGRGSGLGLSLVHGLARQQGGDVTIRSAPGSGTTVRVGFPVPEVSPSVRDDAPPRRSPGTRSGSVLVAEDEDSIRHAVRRVLERQGYAVFQAADGIEALGWLDEYGSEIDLVISDVVMPRLDGLGLYRTVRERGWTHRFLFTSGFQIPQVGELIDSDPELAFLAKPWSVPEFISKIEDALVPPRCSGPG